MFNNNKVINDLYSKINELSKFKERIFNNRKNIYAISAILSFITLISIISTTPYTIDGPLIFISLITFSISSSAFINILAYDDVFTFFWPKSEKTLNHKKQEIIDFISQDNVQIELINFNFNYVSSETVIEFRKHLALKDYHKAYSAIKEILTIQLKFESKEASEAETKKLIAEHELSLKMKL